jgi:hypothetical protein
MIGVSTSRIWNCIILSSRKFLLYYKKVLNTVLYNRKEGTNNVVKKRQAKPSLSSVSSTDADSLFDGGVEIENATFKIQKNSPQNKPEVVNF